MLLFLFHLPPAGCGRILGCCDAALMVPGKKHVVDPRVSVMASALSTCVVSTESVQSAAWSLGTG